MDVGKRGENSSRGNSRGIDMKMPAGPGTLASCWMRPDCLEPWPPPREIVLILQSKISGAGGKIFFDQDYIVTGVLLRI